MRNRANTRKRRGFTLVEVLIVVPPLRSSDQRFTDIFSRTGATMEELRKRFLAIRSTLEGGDGVDRASLMQMVGYRKVPTGGGMG